MSKDRRPNEECPLQRNDTSVRSTQDNLFLCPNCEEFRFPRVRTSAQLSSKPSAAGKKQATSKNRAALLLLKMLLKTLIACLIAVGAARLLLVACFFPAFKDADTGKSNKLATESKYGQSDNEEDCVYYREAITVSTASIMCDVSKHVYHPSCSSLSADVFSVLNTIVNHAGWVCRQCRNSQPIRNLKCSLTKVNEELADMRVTLHGVNAEVNCLKNAPSKQLDIFTR